MSKYELAKKFLEENGYHVDKCERWIPVRGNFAQGKRLDLFNIIDAIAIREGEILGVQVCGSDFSPHVKKMLEEFENNTREWLLSGAKLILIGFRKKKWKLKNGSWSKGYKYFPRIAIFRYYPWRDSLNITELTQAEIDGFYSISI